MQNLKKIKKKDNENEKKQTLSVNIVKSNTIVLRDKERERERDGLDIGSARLNAIGILKNHIQYYIYPN